MDETAGQDRELPAGSNQGKLSGKRSNFAGWGQRTGNFGDQGTALGQRWDSRTERGLFGDQRLQLALSSTSSCRSGTVSGVVVIGMGLSVLEKFAVC